MCAQIRGPSCTDMRADLFVDVEVVETTDLLNANAKCLSKFRAQLQSNGTEVLLPHPVLIRPGFFYNICIGKIPGGHYLYSKGIKMNVWLEPDIKIEIRPSILHAIGANFAIALDVISALKFNKI